MTTTEINEIKKEIERLEELQLSIVESRKTKYALHNSAKLKKLRRLLSKC